jgi:DNA-binding HxlR family transcriptional regulator
MPDNYKGQSNRDIDIYRDYEDFYASLTDKADRIHNAISLVTKYTVHKDSATRLESIGIDFLEMSYMLHPTFGEEHRGITSQLSFTIKELKTITTGLVIKGTLSHESKTLFDQQLDSYLSLLTTYVEHHIHAYTQKQQGIISPLFNEDFFGSELKQNFTFSTLAPTSQPTQATHSIANLPPQKDKTLSENQKIYGEEKPRKNEMSFKKDAPDKSQGHVYEDGTHKGQSFEKKKTDVVDRINRKTSILNFIKENKEAQIKDILVHIGNCSEKTIQRELNELIKDGVLKKEGDRRWSKYSLLKDIRS